MFRSGECCRINQTLDEELEEFSQRKLDKVYPYLILTLCDEKVREDNALRNRALLVLIGISLEGQRCVLATDLAGTPCRLCGNADCAKLNV